MEDKMSDITSRCGSCAYQFTEADLTSGLSQCPKCGSGDRLIAVDETARPHESISMQAKDLNLTGKKKVRKKVFVGDDYSHAAEKWRHKVRIVDQDTDSYYEKVTDKETGEVIHYCEEPLTEHQGHGNAKFKTVAPSDTEP
jgi:hypothetical protein